MCVWERPTEPMTTCYAGECFIAMKENKAMLCGMRRMGGGRKLAVFHGNGQGRNTDRMVTEQKLEGKAGGMWILGSNVFQVKGSATP